MSRPRLVRSRTLWVVIATANDIRDLPIVYGLWLRAEEAEQWIKERPKTPTTYSVVPYYPRETVNAPVA